MIRLKRLAGVLVVIAAASQLAFSSGPRAEGKPIVVFAAASLKNALDDAIARYASAADHRVVVSYAASSTLAKQIVAGAPAQLFFSADQDWMDFLEKNDALAPGTRQQLLGNALVLIAPKDTPVQVTLGPGVDLTSPLNGGRLAVAETTSVPAGKYAKAALTHFGIWAAVEPHLAQAANVRAALALVARGEAPLGIVYATDAAAEPAVRVVATFPADAHPAIVYPVALTKEAASQDASDFLAFLASKTAATIFARHGFTSLACGQGCRDTN